jgi:hypothetical protein
MVIYLLCRVHNLDDEFDIQALLFQRFKKYHQFPAHSYATNSVQDYKIVEM